MEECPEGYKLDLELNECIINDFSVAEKDLLLIKKCDISDSDILPKKCKKCDLISR